MVALGTARANKTTNKMPLGNASSVDEMPMIFPNKMYDYNREEGDCEMRREGNLSNDVE
jgi:hypothetical protein